QGNFLRGTGKFRQAGQLIRIVLAAPQREDRVNRLLAALHESAFGTKRTTRAFSCLSAFGGKADKVQAEREVRFWTQSGHRAAEIPQRSIARRVILNSGSTGATGTMKRREVLVTLLGGAAAWPLVARAQQPPRVPTIRFLGSGTATTAGIWVAAFAQRLRELGWIENRTIKIELRWAEGRHDRSAEIATESVLLNINIIVTYGSEQVQIPKEATATIPIIFATAGDPVGSGLVASLAHPGGNITGVSSPDCHLTRKTF